MSYFVLGLTSTGKSTLAENMSGCFYFPSEILYLLTTKQTELFPRILQIVTEKPENFRPLAYFCKRPLRKYFKELRKLPDRSVIEWDRFQEMLDEINSMLSPVILEGEILSHGKIFATIQKSVENKCFLLELPLEVIWQRYQERYPAMEKYPNSHEMTLAKNHLANICQEKNIPSGDYKRIKYLIQSSINKFTKLETAATKLLQELQECN